MYDNPYGRNIANRMNEIDRRYISHSINTLQGAGILNTVASLLPIASSIIGLGVSGGADCSCEGGASGFSKGYFRDMGYDPMEGVEGSGYSAGVAKYNKKPSIYGCGKASIEKTIQRGNRALKEAEVDVGIGMNALNESLGFFKQNKKDQRKAITSARNQAVADYRIAEGPRVSNLIDKELKKQLAKREKEAKKAEAKAMKAQAKKEAKAQKAEAKAQAKREAKAQKAEAKAQAKREAKAKKEEAKAMKKAEKEAKKGAKAKKATKPKAIRAKKQKPVVEVIGPIASAIQRKPRKPRAKKAPVQGMGVSGGGISGGMVLAPSRAFGGAILSGATFKGKGISGGRRLKPQAELKASDMTGGRKRSDVVKQVMAQKGLSMIDASKYVKAHGLY